MQGTRRKTLFAVGAAIIAGLSAAAVAYLLIIRPGYRKHVIGAGRMLLGLADGVLHRKS